MSTYRLVEPIHTTQFNARRTKSNTKSSTSSLHSSSGSAFGSKRLSSRYSKQTSSTPTGLHNSQSSEFAIFSFDEELEYELRREKEAAPVFHVGRNGGTGTYQQQQQQQQQQQHDSQSNYYGNGYNYNTSNYGRKQSTTSSIGSSNSHNSDKAWTKRDADSWRQSSKHYPS